MPEWIQQLQLPAWDAAVHQEDTEEWMLTKNSLGHMFIKLGYVRPY